MLMQWVLIDRSGGARTKNGEQLSPLALRRMARAVQDQINHEFAREWGVRARIRAGRGARDIRPGEWAYFFLPHLKDPGISADHEFRAGDPVALCAVPTCGSLFGPDGLSVDVSHELLETAGDPGSNLFASDARGVAHAFELCDAVEMQTYVKTLRDGARVHVSNWLVRAWFVPGARGPYSYMAQAGLKGAVDPPAPLKTAPGKGGNYQIVGHLGRTRDESALRISGTRRKGRRPDEHSRAGLRLAHRLRRQAEPLSVTRSR